MVLVSNIVKLLIIIGCGFGVIKSIQWLYIITKDSIVQYKKARVKEKEIVGRSESLSIIGLTIILWIVFILIIINCLYFIIIFAY